MTLWTRVVYLCFPHLSPTRRIRTSFLCWGNIFQSHSEFFSGPLVKVSSFFLLIVWNGFLLFFPGTFIRSTDQPSQVSQSCTAVGLFVQLSCFKTFKKKRNKLAHPLRQSQRNFVESFTKPWLIIMFTGLAIDGSMGLALKQRKGHPTT